jgi:hypothetical protein
MLVIRLSRGTPWQARYTLIDGRSYEEWAQSDTQSNALLAAAIDGAADRLARRYAIEPQGSAIGGVDWWIDDVRSAQDYANVVGYFGRLEFVRDVRVLRAEGESPAVASRPCRRRASPAPVAGARRASRTARPDRARCRDAAAPDALMPQSRSTP